MIRFACPACLSLYDTDERNAGQNFRCSKCSQRVRVPDPQAAREGVLVRRSAGPSWSWGHRRRPTMPLLPLMLGAPALAIGLSLLVYGAQSLFERLRNPPPDQDTKWEVPAPQPKEVREKR
jgi:hypothetical protein